MVDSKSLASNQTLPPISTTQIHTCTDVHKHFISALRHIPQSEPTNGASSFARVSQWLGIRYQYAFASIDRTLARSSEKISISSSHASDARASNSTNHYPLPQLPKITTGLVGIAVSSATSASDRDASSLLARYVPSVHRRH